MNHLFGLHCSLIVSDGSVWWQATAANGHCFTDVKIAATSTTSLQSCRNAQSSFHSGVRPSSEVHSMKPSVLPLQQAVHSTSAVGCVTTASVKTQLPTLVSRPLHSTVTTSLTTSTPCSGQLLLILKH